MCIPRPIYTPLLLLALIATLAPAAGATTVRELSLLEVIEQASWVVEARVVRVRTVRGDDQGRLRTCARLHVIDVVAGTPPASPELCFEGGSLGDARHRVLGMIYPERGEVGIFFVRAGAQYVNPLVGWQQGQYRVVPTLEGVDVVHSAGDLPIVGLDAGQTVTTPRISRGVARGIATSGEGAAATMSVEAFKARVREMAQ